MASSNEIRAPLKPTMRFMLPHEIFHGTKPAHEWYEHMDNYDDEDEEEEEEEEEEVGHCHFHNVDDGDGDEDYNDGYDEDDENDDDDDDDDDDDEEDDDDSVFSLLVQDEIDQHESENFTSDHYYTQSLDGSDPTLHQDDDDDDDDDDDEEDDEDSVFSLFVQDEIDQHESENFTSDHYYTLSLDGSDPTLHQDDDQDPTLHLDGDYDEGYLTVPLSPPRSVLYFDCNMCMKVAREPVVTSCGHLYCWPCLYSWLNIYSAQRECLVCKSKVFDSLITPIYNCRDINSGFKVPPRPEPKGLRLS
ncbi:hypothetical protein CerSpe_079470 [Prunus speciosa]